MLLVLRKYIALTLYLLALLCLNPAEAEQEFNLNIPSQSLPIALDQLSVQTGYQVSADSNLIKNKNSQSVVGSLQLEQAIERLLFGTGLTWLQASSNTIIITNNKNIAANVMLLPSVKVEARRVDAEAERPYEQAASTSHISKKQVERFRGASVGDIFQGQSGVLVGENRNSGGLDVNIRGMQGQGRVPVLLDGSRQETTVYRGYAGVASRTYIDPDLIGAIDIYKGPEMSSQATGATGGVVSVRSLEARDLIQDNKNYGVRLKGGLMGNTTNGAVAPDTSSGYNPVGADNGAYRINCVVNSLCEGPYDINKAYGAEEVYTRPDFTKLNSWSGSFAYAQRFDATDLVLAYAKREQGNYFAGSNGPAPELDLSDQINRGFWTEVRPKLTGVSRFRAKELIVNSNFESTSSLVKSTFYLSDFQSLKLAWQSYKSDYGELMPSQLIWFGQVKQTDGSTVDTDTYTLSYNQQSIEHNWIDLEANLWHTDTTSSNQSYTNDVSFGLAETEEYQRWGSDISNKSSVQDWLFEYGLSWQKEKIDTQPTESNLIFGRKGNRQEFSAFVNTTWQITDTLEINSGVRYSHFSVEDHKPQIVDSDSPFCKKQLSSEECELIYFKNSDSGLAPLVSLSWQLSSNIQGYYRYAEALRMPSLFESSTGFSTQPALDVEVKPEHAKNHELGLNIRKDNWLVKQDWLRVKLAYFRNHTDDYLTRTTPNLWEKESSRLFFVTRNIDKVELFGSELMAEYDARWIFGSISMTYYHKIEVCHYGSYRREDCNDYGIANSYINNMIPPNYNSSATLGLRLFKQRLETGLRYTKMGKRNPVPEFNDDTQRGTLRPVAWHSYELIDLFASYQISNDLNIDFNIDNITDKYYLDALSLGLVPAPGRTARLGITLNF
ncbi:TonB-dependent receptor [Pseudoalteromonas prydzensis]|uniref:TonB-dependent receptor n=1 Tax=Pseudoalteromonas prydzensis TaxID=182141 RepID=A0ABR9FKD8_9GAMM|nr:TonB-dependent receptor [Pseudoalteromonas prydzensis]MBE0457296.1 TonB-dependent receptor [Pseudoalteromonas prydzensis]